MKRREDWPERLTKAVETANTRPFRWGEHDCVLFVADCVLAMTGEDLAVERGQYADRMGAIRILAHAYGTLSVDGLFTRLFGTPIPRELAQRGDVAVVMAEGRESAGMVLGATVAAPGRTGLLVVPLASARAAWSVAR